ncbi:MAG: hypothetical protein HYY17_14340 [Planctomycetes bacterium]|nr:hypothetical protein [Planctomycetota bacterium]
MRKAIAAAVMIGLGGIALPQEQASNAYEVKYKYEKALKQIRGVLDVSIAGSGSDLRLVLRVESEEARETVRILFGDQIRGCRLHFIVSGAAVAADAPRTEGDCSRCVCPCHKSGRTVAAPWREEPKPVKAEEPCDVMRELLGLAKRHDVKNGVVCQQMVGWTNSPVQIEWVKKNNLPHWQSQELGSFFVAYTYIKHRRSCPHGRKILDMEIENLTPKVGK